MPITEQERERRQRRLQQWSRRAEAVQQDFPALLATIAAADEIAQEEFAGAPRHGIGLTSRAAVPARGSPPTDRGREVFAAKRPDQPDAFDEKLFKRYWSLHHDAVGNQKPDEMTETERRYYLGVVARREGKLAEPRGFWGNVGESLRRGEQAMETGLVSGATEVLGGDTERMDLMRDVAAMQEAGDPITPQAESPALAFLEEGAYDTARMAPPFAVSAAMTAAAPPAAPYTSGTFWYLQGVAEIKDDLRRSGTSDERASQLALIAAVPYAAVEQMQVKGRLPAGRAGGAKLALRKWAKKELPKMGREWTKEWGKQITEEMIQQATISATSFLAAEGFGEGEFDLETEIGEVIETGYRSIVPMALLMGPGKAIELGAAGATEVEWRKGLSADQQQAVDEFLANPSEETEEGLRGAGLDPQFADQEQREQVAEALGPEPPPDAGPAEPGIEPEPPPTPPGEPPGGLTEGTEEEPPAVGEQKDVDSYLRQAAEPGGVTIGEYTIELEARGKKNKRLTVTRGAERTRADLPATMAEEKARESIQGAMQARTIAPETPAEAETAPDTPEAVEAAPEAAGEAPEAPYGLVETKHRGKTVWEGPVPDDVVQRLKKEYKFAASARKLKDKVTWRFWKDPRAALEAMEQFPVSVKVSAPTEPVPADPATAEGLAEYGLRVERREDRPGRVHYEVIGDLKGLDEVRSALGFKRALRKGGGWRSDNDPTERLLAELRERDPGLALPPVEGVERPRGEESPAERVRESVRGEITAARQAEEAELREAEPERFDEDFTWQVEERLSLLREHPREHNAIIDDILDRVFPSRKHRGGDKRAFQRQLDRSDWDSIKGWDVTADAVIRDYPGFVQDGGELAELLSRPDFGRLPLPTRDDAIAELQAEMGDYLEQYREMLREAAAEREAIQAEEEGGDIGFDPAQLEAPTGRLFEEPPAEKPKAAFGREAGEVPKVEVAEDFALKRTPAGRKQVGTTIEREQEELFEEEKPDKPTPLLDEPFRRQVEEKIAAEELAPDFAAVARRQLEQAEEGSEEARAALERWLAGEEKPSTKQQPKAEAPAEQPAEKGQPLSEEQAELSALVFELQERFANREVERLNRKYTPMRPLDEQDAANALSHMAVDKIGQWKESKGPVGPWARRGITNFLLSELRKQGTAKGKTEQLGMAAEDIQGFGAGADVPVSLEDSPAGRTVSEHDIQKTMERDFGVKVFRGRLPAKFAGVYVRLPETVRLHSPFMGNLAVAAHEMAHHLDKKEELSGIKKFKDELSALDYQPEKKRVSEGFAEFVRHYLTMDDAAEVAPKFHEHFEKWLEGKGEKWALPVRRAKKLIDRWRAQGPTRRAQTQQMGRPGDLIDVSKWEQLPEQLRSWLDWAYNAGIDKTWILEKVAKQAEIKGKKWQYGETRAVDLLRAYMMAAPHHAGRALWSGVHTVSESDQIIGESLREALEPIGTKDYEDWKTYAHAVHALEVYEKKPGYNPGISQADAQAIVDRVREGDKAERYETAREKFTAFNNSLVAMLVDAGVLTPQDYTRMTEQWETYVPLMRAVKKRGFGQRGGLTSAESPVRRRSRRGAGDPLIDIVEATVMRATRFYEVAMKKQVLLQFVKETVPTLGGVEGMGDWIQEVQPNMKATRGKLEDALDATVEEGLIDESDARELKIVATLRAGEVPSQRNLEWLAERHGVEYEEAAADIVDELLDATSDVGDLEAQIAIWRPNLSASPKENIIRVVIDGQPRLFQLDETLYAALDSISPPQLNTFLRVLEAFNITRKLGAVGLSPGFGLANIERDWTTYQHQAEHVGVDSVHAPFLWLGRYMKAEGQEFFGKEFQEDVVEFAKESGLELSTWMGMHRAGVRQARGELVGGKGTRLEQLFMIRRPGKSAARWVEEVKNVITASDMGPRLAEFAGVLREHGYVRDPKTGHIINETTGERERPPRHVLIEATNAANDATVNFKRSGRYTQTLNRIWTFLNAAVQSNDRFARTFVGAARDLKASIKGQPNKGRWKRLAVSLALRISATALYWTIRHDDDDYKEQEDWLTYGYWTFADAEGNPLIRIPKGYEWSIFDTLTEATLNAINRQDGGEYARAMKYQAYSMAPGFDLVGVDLGLELFSDYSFFHEKPIEGPYMKHRPESLRYHGYNLETSKFLGYYTGETVGLSPAKLEHALNSVSGGMYGRTVGLLEKLLKRDATAADIPGAGKFIIRRDYARSVNEFYGDYQSVQEARYRNKELGEEDEALDRRAAFYDDTAALMSAIREKTDDLPREERELADRYIVGLARFALDKEELERYPNPLKKDAELPETIRPAVETFLGNLAMQAAEVPYTLKKGESWTEERKAAKSQREEQIEYATELLRRLDQRSLDLLTKSKKYRGYGLDAKIERRKNLNARLAPAIETGP